MKSQQLQHLGVQLSYPFCKAPVVACSPTFEVPRLTWASYPWPLVALVKTCQKPFQVGWAKSAASGHQWRWSFIFPINFEVAT